MLYIIKNTSNNIYSTIVLQQSGVTNTGYTLLLISEQDNTNYTISNLTDVSSYPLRYSLFILNSGQTYNLIDGDYYYSIYKSDLNILEQGKAKITSTALTNSVIAPTYTSKKITIRK
jgi:hypothetical protein